MEGLVAILGTLPVLWDEEALEFWAGEEINWPSYSLYPSSCQHQLMILLSNSVYILSLIIRNPKFYLLFSPGLHQLPTIYSLTPIHSQLLPPSTSYTQHYWSTLDYIWFLASTTINSWLLLSSSYHHPFWLFFLIPTSKPLDLLCFLTSATINPNLSSPLSLITSAYFWLPLPHGSCPLISLLSQLLSLYPGSPHLYVIYLKCSGLRIL